VPTINGSPTIREAGQMLIEHLTNAAFSEPYIAVDVLWKWKLEIDPDQRLPILPEPGRALIVVTPDWSSPIQVNYPDSCDLNNSFDFIVIVLGRISTADPNDFTGDQEMAEATTFSQEVGERLIQVAAVPTPAVFVDVTRAQMDRIFVSAWEASLTP
jgi:hypothetical protein